MALLPPFHPTRREWLAGCTTLAASLTGVKRALGGWLPSYRVTTPPRLVPLVNFATEDGKGQTLDDYRGRVILLNIWATWCAPCVLEMPSLDALQKQKGGDKFTVLPVATRSGDVTRLRAFYEANRIANLPLLYDPDNDILRGLGDRILPLSLLINGRGEEVGRSVGSGDWASPQALLTVERILLDE